MLSNGTSITAEYDFLIAPDGMMNTTRWLEITRYSQTSKVQCRPVPVPFHMGYAAQHPDHTLFGP
jgi:hypothetical protein